MEGVTRIRPSLWHGLWGVPVFLAGAGFFVYSILHGVMHVTDSLTQLVVPGKAELSLQQGQYTVFLEEQSIVNGEVFSTTQSVDGLVCRISSVPSGAAVPIGQASSNVTYSVNGRSGHSVLEFSIQQDGKYGFACDYGESPMGPRVVVAVGSGVGEAIFRIVAVALLSAFGGVGAGVIPILVVAIKREREKKRLWQMGSFSGSPANDV